MRNQGDSRPGSSEAAEATPRLAVMLGWGAMGFLVGAVFWHFVGFWGFVSTVVLSGGPRPVHIVEQAGPDCVDLRRDAITGEVTALRCPDVAPLLVEAARGREDNARPVLAQSTPARRWTVLVSQDEDDGGPAER